MSPNKGPPSCTNEVIEPSQLPTLVLPPTFVPPAPPPALLAPMSLLAPLQVESKFLKVESSKVTSLTNEIMETSQPSLTPMSLLAPLQVESTNLKVESTKVASPLPSCYRCGQSGSSSNNPLRSVNYCQSCHLVCRRPAGCLFCKMMRLNGDQVFDVR